MLSRTLIPTLLLTLLLTGFASGGEVFHRDKARFEDFPREIGRNGSITFRVELSRGFRGAVLAVADPTGKTRYVKPARSFGVRGFEFDVIFEGRTGAWRLELVVDSTRGDTTAAQFTIWAGVPRSEKDELDEPRAESEFEPEREGEHPVRLERKLFVMINDYREKQGLKPYPWLEEAAYLAREHMRGYLALKPRPKKLTHQLPGHGYIADRFKDTFAWPTTIRKFPIEDPNIGPEAVCFCSESLAAPRSLTWLFQEYFLRESAFRAPVISTYATHAGIGIVREKPAGYEKPTGYLYLASVIVQVNSTRVLAELKAAREEQVKLEASERDPVLKAKLLRRLGRMGDATSKSLFKRRLSAREPEVRAAAADALFLNFPKDAETWVSRQHRRVEKLLADHRYPVANGILWALANLQYDAAGRTLGEEGLAPLERLATKVFGEAEQMLAAGHVKEAWRMFSHLAERMAGLPAGEDAAKRVAEMEADPKLAGLLSD